MNRLAQVTGGRGLLEFDRRRFSGIGSDKAIAVAPVVDHHRGFRPQHGVDAPYLVADLPGDLEEYRFAAFGLVWTWFGDDGRDGSIGTATALGR